MFHAIHLTGLYSSLLQIYNAVQFIVFTMLCNLLCEEDSTVHTRLYRLLWQAALALNALVFLYSTSHVLKISTFFCSLQTYISHFWCIVLLVFSKCIINKIQRALVDCIKLD